MLPYLGKIGKRKKNPKKGKMTQPRRNVGRSFFSFSISLRPIRVSKNVGPKAKIYSGKGTGK